MGNLCLRQRLSVNTLKEPLKVLPECLHFTLCRFGNPNKPDLGLTA